MSGFYESWFVEYPNGFTETLNYHRNKFTKNDEFDISNMIVVTEIIGGVMYDNTYPTMAWPMSACGEARWCYNPSGERNELHQERPPPSVK